MKTLIVIFIAVIGMAFILYMADMLGMSKSGITLASGGMFGALIVGIIWALLYSKGKPDFIVKLEKDENDG